MHCFIQTGYGRISLKTSEFPKSFQHSPGTPSGKGTPFRILSLAAPHFPTMPRSVYKTLLFSADLYYGAELN